MRSFTNIKGLTSKAKKRIALFQSTLKGSYTYPLYVKSKEIEIGLSISGSEVRAIVRTLRRNGVLVISSSKGYSFTDDEKTFRMTTLTHLNDRVSSLQKTIKDCERAMSVTHQGQCTFLKSSLDGGEPITGYKQLSHLRMRKY